MSVEVQVHVKLFAHLFEERGRDRIVLHESCMRNDDAVPAAGRVEDLLRPCFLLFVEGHLVVRRVRAVDAGVRLGVQRYEAYVADDE